ncbi:MAG: LysE family transporter [Eubacteriales bacterium]|nr:LysE family transporter [Eubacteriales bacterium]
MPNPIPFITILLISTLTPGPNNILSMSRAAQVGFRQSFRLNLGMYFGFLVINALLAAFNFYLVAVLPIFKPILQVAGAAYILWLAWTIAFSNSHKPAKTSRASTFWMGFALQFINPKVIIFGLTLLATFITPYYSNPLTILSFVVLIATAGFLATCAWGLFGSLFSKLFLTHEKVMNRILGLLLAGSALSLFL